MNTQEVEIQSLQPIKEKVITNKKNNNIEKILKRSIDILAGICGVILLIPLTIGIYIARKILKEDDGPIFYEQLRLGKNGKYFRMYKYRTMVIGAEEKLEKYLQENEEARKEFEANQKLKNDPRVTRLGKILRRTSLDEMPQLINVLKGEMSLVGPRPIVNREIPLFGDSMKIIHSVRPGITGYWAANGRSNVPYDERVEMERYYAENHSIKLDLKILVKTVESVIKKKGAI